ncbi:FtsX-like permease family protein [Streptomyces sp. NPDC014894]|uniref:FtsX-like permease family protein n=1 Tax=Streptomyces sp. NPDC014894 TaxID=3364931 RepID=UPI0036F953AD
MTGFLFLRARGHRLLLAAALLAILLTTAVLTTLTSFAGSVGDAGLRHALRTRDAAAAALIITSESPGEDRAAAARDARRGAQRAFDGLPVTLRQFDLSGPYALPSSLRPKDRRAGDPDLATFAVVDRSRVRMLSGDWPASAPGGAGGVAEVALPEAAARELKLSPGPRVLTLKDRLGGEPVRIRVTGVYRPADRADPYWQLDDLAGRGVRKESDFSSYGPLLTDPAVFGSGRISRGELAWLAAADFTALTADRIGPLRDSAKESQRLVATQPSLKSGVTVRTALPDALDRLERALLVSRATLLIVSLQLVLLAGYALLLVARLLSSERAGETRFLLARGASRGRIAGLSALEALLLALPAAALAPLLAGPLTRLLAGRGLLARIGLRIETGATVSAWLTGAAVALACAAAVVAPALAAARAPRGRAGSLPGPLRAGADVALLAVAGVAFWQLERRTSGSGALSGDRAGELGIDPLLVVAPALALLAGTVLTLRLLPPAARFAERRAARGRGLTAPLAGWQFSRRPMRGAGPVLLLVLAVAMGMLAIGQGASWDRSQDDQADFAAGSPVRVLDGGAVPPFGQSGAYDGMKGVRAAPAARGSMSLSGGKEATVLALDASAADGRLRLRGDLAGDGGPDRFLAPLRPGGAAGEASRSEAGHTGEGSRSTPGTERRAGIVLPAGSERLTLDLTLRAPPGTPGPPDVDGVPETAEAALTVTVEDRFGVPYRMPLGTVRPDGERRSLTLDLARAAGAPAGRPAGPLALTAVEFEEGDYLDRIVPKRFTLHGLRAAGGDGALRPVAAPEGTVWKARASANVEPGLTDGTEARPAVTGVRSPAGDLMDISYHTGKAVPEWPGGRVVTVRASVKRPAPAVPAALADRRFLESAAAKVGSVVNVPMPGGDVEVRIAGELAHLPTTGPGVSRAHGGTMDGAVGGSGAGPAATDGGAILLDLRAVNSVLAQRPDAALPATEWWLFTAPGAAAGVAAELRERPELDPGQVLVRDEIADELHDDPLGAGPQSALLAVTLAAAALAAVGFAVSTVGALRERSAEFAVLRALGAPRRQLASLLAAEGFPLIALALGIGVAIGAVLTRAVVPLIVLTGRAAQPVPAVLVELPAGRVALLLAVIAAAPVLMVTALALRRGDPASALRVQGGE